MLPILIPFFALALPAQLAVAMATPDGVTVCAQHAVVQRTANPVVLRLAADDEQTTPNATARTLVLRTKDETDEPKVWIGVRLTAVPAPLAAHVGERGVMISNVVQDSPADKAGIEQYDIVLKFGDQDINRPQDLTDAVAKTEPGKSTKLVILRKAQQQELQIKPVERPTDADFKLKYEEPEEAVVNESMKMFGKALQRGPNGEWTIENLGPLQGLPDALKELGKLELKLNLKGLPPDDQDVIILHEPGDEEGELGPESKDVKVEVKVQVADDGSRTTIQRDADGKFHVTHVDKDGQETSATYDSLEALKEGDAAAYQLYSHVSIGREPRLLRRPLPLDRFRTLRRDYQVDVEKKVKEALEQAKQARQKAEKEYERALDGAKEQLGKARVEVRVKKSDQPGATTEVLIVKVDDNGKISVVTTKDGEQVKHEFKSKDEFKNAEPELYEKVKSLLE